MSKNNFGVFTVVILSAAKNLRDAAEILRCAQNDKKWTLFLDSSLDWLLPHKARIEQHLKERLGSLFDLEYDLLLYDVTNTYFEAVANRRLGRLMCQYWRAGGAFDVKIERLSPPQGKARLRVAWTRNDRWNAWAALSEGCYLLRTNLRETDPAVLWKRYIQLTEAEWAFRISKDELVRLRCVTEPDEAQKVLLHRLGITLPRRLRRIDEFIPM